MALFSERGRRWCSSCQWTSVLMRWTGPSPMPARDKWTTRPAPAYGCPVGSFISLAAADAGQGVFGYKAYPSFAGPGGSKNDDACSTITRRGEMLACMEAARMGQIRTGAASGLATRYMAREDAATVAVIGSGFQARTQLEAVCNVRTITEAKVFSRRQERREDFASRKQRAGWGST